MVVNTLAGSSGEMMFNFINTFQIINLFPVWHLNIPEHYLEFLTAMQSTKLDIFKILNIKVNSEYNTWIQNVFIKESQLEYSKLSDEKYVKNDYTHSAFLKNTSDVNSTIF